MFLLEISDEVRSGDKDTDQGEEPHKAQGGEEEEQEDTKEGHTGVEIWEVVTVQF